MTDDAFKQAELRGYSRGYAAGKKKREAARAAEREKAAKQAFLDRAFLVALPVCIEASNWKTGDKPITSLDDRVDLAWRFAVDALKKRKKAL